MKKWGVIIIILLTLFAITLCNSKITSAQWLTNQRAEFTWENTNPDNFDLEYKIYIAPLHKYNPTLIGRVSEKSFIYQPFVEGYWVVGVIPVRIENEIDISEADICWSDNPECTTGGSTFQIRVLSKKEVRWRIIWK